MPVARAKAAVIAGRELMTVDGDDIPERISGVGFPDAVWARFVWLGDCHVKKEPPLSTPPLRLLLKHASAGDWDYVARKLAIDDYPSRLVATLATAPLHPGVGELQPMLRVLNPVEALVRDVWHDRAIASLYLLSTYSSGKLDLGQTSWTGATPAWRADAAPWVLAAANPDDGTALVRVLDAARALGLSFVEPGRSPFSFEPPNDWYAEVRNRAASSVHLLQREPKWPTWFSDPATGVQVLLAADDEYGVAWVGTGKRGLLVSFGVDDFDGYALGEPGVELALGVAISWYIDCTVKISAKGGGGRQQLFGRSTSTTHVKYVPTVAYKNQYQQVRGGHHRPPRAHMVAAFIRHLTSGTPNPDHVAEAPRKLARRMGPNDTWVRAHARGSGTAQELEVRLSRYSALGDALGLATKSGK